MTKITASGIIVVIILILVSCTQSSLAGRAIIPANAQAISCTDTDEGQTLEQAGEIQYTFQRESAPVTRTRIDNCNGTELTEYYCEGIIPQKIKIRCEQGCVADACATEEDYYDVETPDQKLEIANNDVLHTEIEGKSIRDIFTFISDDELDILSNSPWTVAGDYFDYQQYLFFTSSNKKSEMVKYTANNNGVVGEFFFVKSGEQIAQYLLEFNVPPASIITAADGVLETTGTFLHDFQNTNITLMGREYAIVVAQRITELNGNYSQNSIKLTLMRDPIEDVLLEGETKTYTLDQKSYQVTLVSINENKIKFEVNGETTPILIIGETFTLPDSYMIGANTKISGETESALFFLGPPTLELRDDDITDDSVKHPLAIGTEDIDGTEVIITGYDDNIIFTIEKIIVEMTAKNDYFVPVGSTLSEAIFSAGDEKEVLFANSWDIKYLGLITEDSHDLKLKRKQNDQYVLRWYDADNRLITMPLAYTSGSQVILGEKQNQKALVLNEMTPIRKNDYFVITGGSPEEGSSDSYLLQYIGTRISGQVNFIRLKNRGNGQIIEYPMAAENPRATIVLGEYSFAIYNNSETGTNDFQIRVDMDTTYKNTPNPLFTTDTLLEGESRSYNLGSQYDIALTFVDSDEAKFNINSQSSPRLKVGEKFILYDGTELEVTEIVYQDYAGGVHSASFTLSEVPFFSNLGLQDNHIVPIMDSYGIKTKMGNYDASAPLIPQDFISLTTSTPNQEDYNQLYPSDITLTINSVTGAATPRINVSLQGLSLILTGANAYNGYTSRGSFINFVKPQNQPPEFTMSYPEKQIVTKVRIVGRS